MNSENSSQTNRESRGIQTTASETEVPCILGEAKYWSYTSLTRRAATGFASRLRPLCPVIPGHQRVASALIHLLAAPWRLPAWKSLNSVLTFANLRLPTCCNYTTLKQLTYLERGWVSEALAMKVPIAHLGTSRQDKPSRLQAETESGDSSSVLWLETAEIPWKNITELLTTFQSFWSSPSVELFAWVPAQPARYGAGLTGEAMLQAPAHAAGVRRCLHIHLPAATRCQQELSTAAVIQAVYSCLRFHSVNGSDLSKLRDIFNFGSFAAKWDSCSLNF